MKIGFTFMNTPSDPHPAELAVLLEERGYHSLWTGEHSHIPVSRKTPWPAGEELPDSYKEISDLYISLAFAAAVTKTLSVGTCIALLHQREIFAQAKTISTLDRLSAGRLIISAGIGWNVEEFENCASFPWKGKTVSHPWKKRYSLMRETVEASRNLWRGADSEAEYHGDLIDFDPVWSGAKCAAQRPEGPPVYLGVMGPNALKHAASWADGWHPPYFDYQTFKDQLDYIRSLLSDNGRDLSSFPIYLQCMQTPDLDELKRIRDLGVEGVTVGVAMDRWDKRGESEAFIDRYAENIVRLS